MNLSMRKVAEIANVIILTIMMSGLTGVVTFSGRAQAAVQERTLSTGIADSTSVLGTKWRKITFTAAQTGTATAKLSWTGTADMRFQILRSNNTVIGGSISASTTSPKIYSFSTVAGTSYFATIWSYSGVGTYTFTLAENFPDTTAPSVPTSLIANSVTESTVGLTWAPSTDNIGVTGYRVYRNSLLVGSPQSTAFTDTGLSESTAYTYYVQAIDAAGNISGPSASITTTTLSSIPDTIAPTTPENVQSTNQTSSTISLQWNASTDDRAINYYRVYRDNTLIGSPAGTSYVDTGLTPATSYTYSVAAVDTSNNVSAYSLELNVTTAEAPNPSTRPNIVIINLDDMRTDSMLALPKVKQWMESGGTNYPQATVPTPSCCPSRATLMSGRYVHNNGQYSQNTAGADLNLMVQRYLKDAGYFTGHSGKFLHWLSLGTVAPHWDRWTYFKGGYTNVAMRWDNQTITSQGYSTTITFDRGIEYINDFENRDDTKPFFVQLTPIAPHSPSTPEAKYASSAVPALPQKPSHTETDRKDKPPFISYTNETYAQGSANRTAMHRALYSVDDQVDRFMNELSALGELDNTLVIFTADNGYMFGEHGRGSKFLPYYESVGVPFYIRWPGHVAPGATDNRYVSHVDITPTVLAAAGVTQNLVELDGKDILSAYSRPLAYSEYYYDPANGNYITTWSSIRNDQFLYVEYYGQTTDRSVVSFREYYDMVNDPYQMQNLLKDSSTANDPNVTVLSETLRAAQSCAGNTCQ